MPQLEFFQFRLVSYLRFFRAGRPCAPPLAIYEAYESAGQPSLDPDDPWPDELHLWSSAAITEACQNVALILKSRG